MEIVELSHHPFFVGAQFHPEFKSRPRKPSPLFLGLCLAASGRLDNFLSGTALSPLKVCSAFWHEPYNSSWRCDALVAPCNVTVRLCSKTIGCHMQAARKTPPRPENCNGAL